MNRKILIFAFISLSSNINQIIGNVNETVVSISNDTERNFTNENAEELITKAESWFSRDSDLEDYDIYHQDVDRVNEITRYIHKQFPNLMYQRNQMDSMEKIVILHQGEYGLKDSQTHIVFRQTLSHPKHYTGHLAYIRKFRGQVSVEWDILRSGANEPKEVFAAAFTPYTYSLNSVVRGPKVIQDVLKDINQQKRRKRSRWEMDGMQVIGELGENENRGASRRSGVNKISKQQIDSISKKSIKPGKKVLIVDSDPVTKDDESDEKSISMLFPAFEGYNPDEVISTSVEDLYVPTFGAISTRRPNMEQLFRFKRLLSSDYSDERQRKQRNPDNNKESESKEYMYRPKRFSSLDYYDGIRRKQRNPNDDDTGNANPNVENTGNDLSKEGNVGTNNIEKVNQRLDNATESRGNATESRENATENRGNSTENQGNTTENGGNAIENQGNATENRGNETENRGNETENRGNASLATQANVTEEKANSSILNSDSTNMQNRNSTLYTKNMNSINENQIKNIDDRKKPLVNEPTTKTKRPVIIPNRIFDDSKETSASIEISIEDEPDDKIRSEDKNGVYSKSKQRGRYMRPLGLFFGGIDLNNTVPEKRLPNNVEYHDQNDNYKPHSENSSEMIIHYDVKTKHPEFEDRSSPFTGILDCDYENVTLSSGEFFKLTSDMKTQLVGFLLKSLRAQCLNTMRDNTLGLFLEDLISLGNDMKAELNTINSIYKKKTLNKNQWDKVISAIYFVIYTDAYRHHAQSISDVGMYSRSPDAIKISLSVRTMTTMIIRGVEIIHDMEAHAVKISKSLIATLSERYLHSLREADILKSECPNCAEEEDANFQDRIQLRALKEFVIFGIEDNFGKKGSEMDRAFVEFYEKRLSSLTGKTAE